ncbi:MAG: hypothetical protein ACOYON_11825 [Fimbriimonas sp.]
MTGAQRRMKEALGYWGESLVVGGTAHLGLVRTISPDRAGGLLTAAELSSASRPIRLATVAHDDTTPSGSTVTWSGLTLTIARIVDRRIRGVLVARDWVLVP